MCGFVCAAGTLAARQEAFWSALASLAPRGPDGFGWEELDLAGVPLRVGHAQFHVRDPQPSASQPMRSASGRSLIVFNGEVYNCEELAHGLEPGGGWRTRSDTEVLLEGLERHGTELLSRVNGMFAFVFVRLDRAEVIAARDRFGIRPLYLAQTPGGWALGSTLRSLVCSGLVPFELCESGLGSFLDFGCVYEPDTIARRVEAVEPGTWRRWAPDTGWCQGRWWSLPEPTADCSLGQVREELAALLVDSVRLRTRSVFPIGIFLSGGTDSSALALTLAHELGRKPVTLSLAFEGEDSSFSEAPYQRRIATLCASDHHEIVIDRLRAEKALEGLFRAMDQPTIDGLNVFLIAGEAAALGARTCFSGAGGDEVFAGYGVFKSLDRYRALFRALRPLPSWVRAAAALPLRALCQWRPLEPRLSKPAQLLRAVDDLADYYVLRRSLFLPDQVARLRGSPRELRPPQLSQRPRSLRDAVSAWSAFEIGNYLRNMLLRDADTFGMAHAVEVRVPLLDHRIVELAFRIPGPEKVAGPEHKPGLQAATRGALPRFTWDRPKTGFNLPLRIWLQRSLVGDPELSGVLDPVEVKRVTKAFRAAPRSFRAWSRRWSLSVLEHYLASMREPPAPHRRLEPALRASGGGKRG